MQTRRFARAAFAVLVSAVTASGLSGCLSNPEPAPLVVATPAGDSAPLSTPTHSTPTPTPTTASPTPSRVPHTKKPSPTKAPAAKPVTTGEVSAALRSSGLPGLAVTTQPAPRTRVGIDTIFYTRSSTVTRTLTIRGTRVEISARPTSYTWSFGDGTGRTTSSPGRPYPHGDITHRYKTAATRYVHVTTTYVVTCRIGGGSWQTLPGTYPATGPNTKLVVIPES